MDLDAIDVYQLLGIDANASSAEINRAYRKVALKYHPDKNDAPDAAEKFHVLTSVLELLNDSQARHKYDNKRFARAEADKRNAAIEGERKRLKDDLEKREKHAANLSANRDLEIKLQKLKHESLTKRKLHQQSLERKITGSGAVPIDGLGIKRAKTTAFSHSKQDDAEETRSVRVKYKIVNDDGNVQKEIRQILAEYGDIAHVLVLPSAASTDKSASNAIVVFDQENSAVLAAQSISKSTDRKSDSIIIVSVSPLNGSSSSGLAAPSNSESYHKSTLDRLRAFRKPASN